MRNAIADAAGAANDKHGLTAKIKFTHKNLPAPLGREKALIAGFRPEIIVEKFDRHLNACAIQ